MSRFVIKMFNVKQKKSSDIIRCKECEHFKHFSQYISHIKIEEDYCDKGILRSPKADEFCSRAKRKEK